MKNRRGLQDWWISNTQQCVFHFLLPLLLSQANLYFVPQQEMPHCQQKVLMILSLTCCSGNKLWRIQKILQHIIPINKNVLLTRNSYSDTLPHFNIVGCFLFWICITPSSRPFSFFRYLFVLWTLVTRSIVSRILVYRFVWRFFLVSFHLWSCNECFLTCN